jgi:putative ATP-dependent endonuclease of the OLD family
LLDVVVPIDPSITVIIGENNAGKTAFLDALRAALPRAAGRRGSVSDYDFHLSTAADDPKKSSAIEIEVTLRESGPNDWPVAVQRDLAEIIQTDPINDIDYIFFRYSAKYDPAAKNYEHQIAFLDFTGQELKGRAASPAVHSSFAQYELFFYLPALRNAADEFSTRSQFWGPILRALEIPDKKRAEVEKAMEQLNAELLKVDPSLDGVTKTLERINDVIVQGTSKNVSIRALPARAFDLLSRSEIAVQGKSTDVRFPLSRHGQGMQSLSVLFLFQAFAEGLLKTSYKPETEAILAIEEPEGHLHPQATRALWHEINNITAQIIVTTHSPYLVENAPLKSLRLLRRSGKETKVCWLRDVFDVDVPSNPELEKFITGHTPKYSYDRLNNRLRVAGKVEEAEYRDLLKCFPAPPDRPNHAKLKYLRTHSLCFVGADVIDALQHNAQRIRGEIFFARCWLLCEGQSEFKLLHYFARLLKAPLDANNVTVIDYQNNGSPSQFAALARAFQFPWFMMCDNDAGGKAHLKAVESLEFDPAEIKLRVKQLPTGDLERFFVESFPDELIPIAEALGRVSFSGRPRDAKLWDDVAKVLRDHKGVWPLRLIEKLRSLKIDGTRVPAIIKDLIAECVKAANA